MSLTANTRAGAERRLLVFDRVPRVPHRRPQGWLTFRVLRELVQAAMRLEVPDDAP
jgi:hypothetical protein